MLTRTSVPFKREREKPQSIPEIHRPDDHFLINCIKPQNVNRILYWSELIGNT